VSSWLGCLLVAGGWWLAAGGCGVRKLGRSLLLRSLKDE